MWCRDIALSEEQIQVLVKNKAEGLKLGQLRAAENKRSGRQRVMADYHRKGELQFQNVSDKEFFVFGLGLYLCEGSKTRRRFIFTNSDPLVIKIMLRWLKTFYGFPLERMGLRVQIHEMHKRRENIIQNYWRKYLGFPTDHPVVVNYIHSLRKKVYDNYDSYYGVMHLRLLKGTVFSYRIQGLIAGITSALNMPA